MQSVETWQLREKEIEAGVENLKTVRSRWHEEVEVEKEDAQDCYIWMSDIEGNSSTAETRTL